MNLSGRVSDRIQGLHSLAYLNICCNGLSSELPNSLSNITSLKSIDVSQNNFIGGFSEGLGRASGLKSVNASSNNFSESQVSWTFRNNLIGKIPPVLGLLSSLETIILRYNEFEGPIPPEFGNLDNIQYLDLAVGSLSGPIPSELGRLKKLTTNSPLQWLDVSSDSLSSDIPAGLCDSDNLTKLILFNNSFSAPIPLGFSTCSSLVRVSVQNNLISRTIPTSFGNLPKLQRLELANNNLTSTIPDDFALSLSLSFVNVSWNRLKSSLPSNILSIPKAIFLTNSRSPIVILDLSSNHFSGKIPQSIASCERLMNWNLGNNQFTGEIPRLIAALPMLAILDLSNNSLSRTIPENFGSSPALEMLNLSYNKLEGPVPNNGILTTINPNDLIGNVELCGGNGILPPCSQSFFTTASRQRKRKRKIHIINHVIVGFVVGISVILSLGLIVFVGKKSYKRWYLYNTFFTDWYKWSSVEWPWRLIAFQRLSFTSADMLACVKESKVIGMGSGEKLWRSDVDVETRDDLFGEVNLLGRLRHRNIVRLLGYLHNENDVMMVYEYMPNGNLGEALLGENSMKMLVDWVSRYNIAVGVVNGLAYFHHDCNPPVIHRDVKSNNILLDADFEARIADFGLARTMVQKNEIVSMVAGSYGYIAPSKFPIFIYHKRYSLLPEKKPLEPEFGEFTDIVEWVQSMICNKRASEEPLDSNIAGQCKHAQEEMLLVL
ncbi:MDIS1-interacting receptor like kinase 1 [Camellia lanceoleosa]|uniref:MDIS1-interacting receptor like kinase 1 n=1 Tax=Camellia lanceoleosa TaxID=1840588 RepID=A0ACC0FKG3_9ERIC|nr:MDIS1-interacting receptor like kinase 1 [Camellia lanceoleosa]